jgi:hypothetical protein
MAISLSFAGTQTLTFKNASKNFEFSCTPQKWFPFKRPWSPYKCRFTFTGNAGMQYSTTYVERYCDLEMLPRTFRGSLWRNIIWSSLQTMQTQIRDIQRSHSCRHQKAVRHTSTIREGLSINVIHHDLNQQQSYTVDMIEMCAVDRSLRSFSLAFWIYFESHPKWRCQYTMNDAPPRPCLWRCHQWALQKQRNRQIFHLWITCRCCQYL